MGDIKTMTLIACLQISVIYPQKVGKNVNKYKQAPKKLIYNILILVSDDYEA